MKYGTFQYGEGQYGGDTALGISSSGGLRKALYKKPFDRGPGTGPFSRHRQNPAEPDGPALSVSPLIIEASGPANGSIASVIITITNTGTGLMDWTITLDRVWLTADDYSGTLAGGAHQDITIGFDISGIPAGVFDEAIIAVAASGALGSPASVAVNLLVGPEDGLPAVQVVHVIDEQFSQTGSGSTGILALWLFDTSFHASFNPALNQWAGLKVNGMTPEYLSHGNNWPAGTGAGLAYLELIYPSPYADEDPTTVEADADAIPFAGGLFLALGDGPDMEAG